MYGSAAGKYPVLALNLAVFPTRARLFEVARHFGVAVPQKGTKAELTAALAGSDQLRLRGLIEWFGRDELRKACELHGLDSSSRARQQLAARLESTGQGSPTQHERNMENGNRGCSENSRDFCGGARH